MLLNAGYDVVDFKNALQTYENLWHEFRIFQKSWQIFEIIRAQKEGFDCLILHDVDLLVENDKILYQCSDQPVHMSAFIDKVIFSIFLYFIFQNNWNF